MQNQAKITQAQEQATESQTAMPAYMPPKIKVYKEENMLKTVTVLGCSLQGGFD